MSPRSSERLQSSNRRTIVRSIGGVVSLGVAGSVAGCGGDSSNGQGTANENSSETAYKQSWNRNYQTVQANGHSAQSYDPHTLPDYLYNPYLNYNEILDEYELYLLDSIDIEGSTMSLTIGDQYNWHNGDPLTADDVVTQFKIAAVQGDPRLWEGDPTSIWQGFDGIQKTGEYTLDVDLQGAYNPRLVILSSFVANSNGPSCCWTPTSVFGRFVESFADATTDEERNQVETALAEFSWDFEDHYGNGLWKIDRITDAQLTMTPYENHPAAEHINFEKIRFRPIEQKVPAMRNGELDTGGATQGTPLPDNWQQVSTDTVNSGGQAVIFDHEHDIYGQTAFKQAMAFLIDTEQVAEVVGSDTARHGPANQAIHSKFEERYLGPPIEGQLIEYGPGSKPDRAAEALESIGFTREDGTWYGPDDEALTIEFNTPAGGWATSANTVAGQLDNFGIQADVLAEEASTYFSKYTNNSYDFCMEFWSGGKATPYDGFSRNMTGFGGGTMNYPTEVQAPPVGERDGALQTYDINASLQAALEATHEEAFVDAVQTLAWIQNYELPCINLFMSLQGGSWFDAEGWTFPPTDSPEWGWGAAVPWRMLNGEFQAK